MKPVDQLRLLWQFQELEQKIHRQEQESQNLISVHEYQHKKKEFALFQEELREKEGDLNTDKKKLRRKELELQTVSNSLKEMDKKLYSGEIRNVKELESLEKNVQSRKKEISELEDEIIFIMEKLENDAGEVSCLKKLEEKKNEELQRLMLKARNELHKVQGELRELNLQREELLQVLDKDLLKKYRELSKRLQGGRCVSLVKGGFCGICNVSLPSSFRGRLLTPGQLVFCENCGSLLVHGD
jgi:predicted  nucleic acid-binding Zn-ribbon protein